MNQRLERILNFLFSRDMLKSNVVNNQNIVSKDTNATDTFILTSEMCHAMEKSMNAIQRYRQLETKQRFLEVRDGVIKIENLSKNLQDGQFMEFEYKSKEEPKEKVYSIKR